MVLLRRSWPEMLGFLSGVDGFDSVVWSAYVLVSHLLSGGRLAFDSGANAFLFGFGLPASGVWGRNSSGLYRILFGSPLLCAFYVPIDSGFDWFDNCFDWNSLVGRGVRLGYSLYGVVSPHKFPIGVMNRFVCVWWFDVFGWDLDWSMTLSKDVNQAMMV